MPKDDESGGACKILGDVVLPRDEGLDRAFPARLGISLSGETIGSEIVNCDRDDEPWSDPDSVSPVRL